MEALQIIKTVHSLFNEEPLSDSEALKVFKGLPADFNDLILTSDWTAFESKLKKHYVYLGLTKEEILQADRNIIGKIIKEHMLSNKVTYAQLGRELAISQSLIYEFVERNASMNLVHLQRILDYFGFAVAVATRDLITDKYYVIQGGNPPTDEDLTGPIAPPEDEEGCVDCEEEDIQNPSQEEIPPVAEDSGTEDEEQKNQTPTTPEGEDGDKQGDGEKDPSGTVPSTEEGVTGLPSDNDGDETEAEPKVEETVHEPVQSEDTSGQTNINI